MQEKDLAKSIRENSQLFFRRAIIYDNMNAKSDMLRVRPIPDMVGFPEDDLPLYSSFNPTTLVKGVSEKDTGSIDKATQIWIICTDDYKVGWVFGEANQQYAPETKKVDDPWAFNALKTHVLRQHLKESGAKYTELKILFSNARFVNAYDSAGIDDNPSTAVGLDVVNVRTGERWMMLQSGTSISLTQNEICLRVGSPDNSPSFLKIKPSGIEMTSDSIAIWGRNATSLGKHGMRIAGMLGAPTGLDGSPLVPFPDLTV